ncbi:T9SS type A sorting domain-containing protein [Brumimicrobium aurantiacum]|uniref:T9SS C-terminal target domain-containing protein n=1 Tax=Brumimicrobium aurantiacum TaxID=1737063 RepID=A0A3E1F2F6_9FLAO|nr:T9SS type A sorting domain-containing protein [Brumimicrobium aurantiacum]RFC55939.1 T9SS C-terminal target domain-containing protein [Brumimicrobium aurantiacum]
MKLTLLFITSLMLAATSVFAQDIEIVSVNDMNTDLSGTSVEAVGDANGQPVYYEFRVINNSSSTIEVKYKRERILNSGLIDAICDEHFCIDADDTYSWTTPQLNTIESGDNGVFKPQVSPNGSEFCGVYKYFVVNDSGDELDSITVLYKSTNAECNLDVAQQETKSKLGIYPNPAQNYVSFDGDLVENGGTVVFLDALGKEVKRYEITSNNSKVSVSDLKRGIYFVNVYGQNGLKSDVQRLVIQ